MDTLTPNADCLKVADERQIEIAHLMADGLQDKQIAARLRMKKNSVTWRIDRLRRKLGATNRAELALAIRPTTCPACHQPTKRRAGGDGRIATTLSLCETKILAALAEGRTNAEIAKESGRSIRTIGNEIVRARDKLGAANAVQAVAMAIRRGILE